MSELSPKARISEPFYGVYEPATRTVYVNDVPSSAAGVGALLDAILQIDRGLKDAPPPLESVRRTAKPSLALVKKRQPFQTMMGKGGTTTTRYRLVRAKAKVMRP
jgi:hypothetical protein